MFEELEVLYWSSETVPVAWMRYLEVSQKQQDSSLKNLRQTSPVSTSRPRDSAKSPNLNQDPDSIWVHETDKKNLEPLAGYYSMQWQNMELSWRGGQKNECAKSLYKSKIIKLEVHQFQLSSLVSEYWHVQNFHSLSFFHLGADVVFKFTWYATDKLFYQSKSNTTCAIILG